MAWQEAEISDGGGRIYLSFAVYSETADGGAEKKGVWNKTSRFAGPYAFIGEQPWIYNLYVDKDGKIIFTASYSAFAAQTLVSKDGGKTFTSSFLPQKPPPENSQNFYNGAEEETIAPKVFQTSNGRYLMFTQRSENQALTLFYASSKDLVSWTPFEPFIQQDGEKNLTLNFLPEHASFEGCEYVVFQSYVPGENNRMSFQLYIKKSEDSGLTWTPARRLTDFRDPVSNVTESPDFFNNERAHISARETSMLLVWERKYINGGSFIYALNIGKSGEPLGRAERISSGETSGYAPRSLSSGGAALVVWFETLGAGNAVYAAVRRPYGWERRRVSQASGASILPAVAQTESSVYIFWQDANGGRIYICSQDENVLSPKVTPLNFVYGEPVNSNLARISWIPPRDSSGIRGFSWVWSMDENASPPREVMAGSGVLSAEFPVYEDGPHHFALSVCDSAGNWSQPARTVFLRDTKPPETPIIAHNPLDAKGYFLSNTFSIKWEGGAEGDAAGYNWSLQYAGTLEGSGGEWAGVAASLEKTFSAPSQKALRVMGSAESAYYTNADNGVYRFVLYAIDSAGNVSRPAVYYFKLNKYIVRTFITVLNSFQDEQGVFSLRIIGRGFKSGGNARTVSFRGKGGSSRERILKDGRDFLVKSDREIYVPSVEHIPEGEYYVVVDHPLRGEAESPNSVYIGRTQTVKHGDYTSLWKPLWRANLENVFILNPSVIIIFAAAVFCFGLIFLTCWTFAFIIKEKEATALEALAVLSGNFMPEEEKQIKKTRKGKRRYGLRLKLTLFTASLVIFVVAIVSIPLYYMMMNAQRDTLLNGLYDRASVLLEAVGTSAKVFLPANNLLELGYLPAQSVSVPEARYITITGYGEGASTSPDYVWATNDPNILEKIDAAELRPGVSRIQDAITPLLKTYQDNLNAQAGLLAGTLAKTVVELNAESLTLIGKNDAESQKRIAEIQETARALEDRITGVLGIMNKEVNSYPEYTIENYAKNDIFILYKPILFRQGSSDLYVRGFVRIEISVESIRERLMEGRAEILRAILLIALAALVVGFLGALALSSIIIGPLKALVRHVEKIRDTEDKSKLSGGEIVIKSRDELAVLANTINEMTQGLVKAAIASQDLTIGKEMQKKFIPLEMDDSGNKKTYGYAKTPKVNFFGYYEGAKGVSGDYFDYRKLDDRYFAVIKCDVAGKGVPAALIMAQVATMFINYFLDWDPQKNNFQFQDLVYQINEFIENLGFKGRFAAFTLCLFDAETGLLRFCNAGDNIIHMYDASNKKMKQIVLSQTPAAGILPGSMVREGGAYRMETHYLDYGDILLLYTDGIEESKRKFRNERYQEIQCAHNGEPDGSAHGFHTVGQWDEEMGPARVEAVINAVMNKSTYNLFKYHDPQGEIEYHFDFTKCSGTVEEVIMAMVSVEKVFRMYYNPASSSNAKILVDSRVDAFLKNHFLEYNKYCSDKEPFLESKNYIYYNGMEEDEQYDDLTILGIKRR